MFKTKRQERFYDTKGVLESRKGKKKKTHYENAVSIS